jgi:hypothetical protein
LTEVEELPWDLSGQHNIFLTKKLRGIRLAFCCGKSIAVATVVRPPANTSSSKQQQGRRGRQAARSTPSATDKPANGNAGLSLGADDGTGWQ